MTTTATTATDFSGTATADSDKENNSANSNETAPKEKLSEKQIKAARTQLQQMRPELGAELKNDSGVLVVGIKKGTSAQGVFKKDDKILKIGETAVQQCEDVVTYMQTQSFPGKKASFEVSRDGKKKTVKVVFGAAGVKIDEVTRLRAASGVAWVKRMESTIRMPEKDTESSSEEDSAEDSPDSPSSESDNIINEPDSIVSSDEGTDASDKSISGGDFQTSGSESGGIIDMLKDTLTGFGGPKPGQIRKSKRGNKKGNKRGNKKKKGFKVGMNSSAGSAGSASAASAGEKSKKRRGKKG